MLCFSCDSSLFLYFVLWLIQFLSAARAKKENRSKRRQESNWSKRRAWVDAAAASAAAVAVAACVAVGVDAVDRLFASMRKLFVAAAAFEFLLLFLLLLLRQLSCRISRCQNGFNRLPSQSPRCAIFIHGTSFRLALSTLPWSIASLNSPFPPCAHPHAGGRPGKADLMYTAPLSLWCSRHGELSLPTSL